MSIREDMPLLARNEGEWLGEYIYVDNDGNVTDRHQSHLTCRFPTNGEYPYVQTNHYTWADGRAETFDFPATYHDKQVWFDTPRLLGHAWEVDDRTIVLTWHYKANPKDQLYEMIQLSPDGQHRARTWHWFENGEIVKRTIIKETRKV